MSGQFQVGHATGRNAYFPPAMHSRDWSLDQFGDSTGPAECVDDFVGIGFHKRNLATIATKVQAKSCDIGNCANGAYDFVDGMDADQIRALVRNGKDKRKALAGGVRDSD